MSVVIPSLRGAIAVPSWAKNELWRKAAAVPSLDLRFADNKSLVDATTGSNLVTFTRASSGTFVDSDGVLQTAVTNLLLRSEDLTVSPWIVTGTVAVTADSSQGLPFAGAKVFGVQFSDANEELNQSYTFSALTYTPSIWVKGTAGETIRFAGKAGQSVSNFTLDGTWQRFTLSPFTANAGTANFNLNTSAGVTARTIYVAAPQLEQSATVGEYIPTTSTINSAPRFDHNPTTGESLGLLVEEQRTNSIRNNTMVGAVAGTPGTLPTNWSATTPDNGITREIVGTGTEDGIAYIDFRFSGTNTLGSTYYQDITFENVAIAAAQNQSWTQSAYVRLLSGAFSGASFSGGPSLVLYSTPIFNDNASVNLAGASNARLATQRFSVTKTFTNELTTGASPRLSWIIATGGTIDFTIRIGLPQLELGAFATSVIPTTTAAVTRSADVASITGSAFSGWYRQDEGTVFVEFGPYGNGGGSKNPGIVQIDSDSTVDRIRMFCGGSISAVLAVDTSSVSQAYISGNALTPSATSKISGSYKINDFARAVNGSNPGTDSSGSVPTVNQMLIGTGNAGVSGLNGTIKRLTFFPQRLANSTLQALTQ